MNHITPSAASAMGRAYRNSAPVPDRSAGHGEAVPASTAAARRGVVQPNYAALGLGSAPEAEGRS